MTTRTGSLRFRGHVVIAGEVECISGLHVGGNRDAISLTGVDHPVARDPASGAPMIPGSSLKGRMRGLLETLRGRVRYDRADTKAADQPDAIDLLFGSRGGAARCGPTRLVVRDGLASGHARDKDTIRWWDALDTDGLGTEVKAESALNRVTAAATPRQVERVVAGSRFDIGFVLHIYDLWDDEERLLKDLMVSLALVEDTYLGGHGSRGYGRVRFRLREHLAIASAADYESCARRTEPTGDLKALSDIDVDAWIASAKTALAGGAT